MSATNGHAPALDELREQVRRQRLQAHLARASHERALWESLGPYRAPDDFANPYGFRRDPYGGLWFPLAAGGPTARKDGRDEPFLRTDSDLDSMRELARWLAKKNPLAIGALGLLVNYAVKKGFEWDARPAEGYEDDGRANDLARQAKFVIDLDSDLNKLPARERSHYLRAVRDGDTLLRHFAQADGTTRHRPVGAELLRDPGNLATRATFGVETEPDDVETVLAYHVTYNGGSTYDRVPADEASYYGRNKDEEVKRGLSDFYSTGEAIDEVGKLLRGMTRGATLLSKIAYIETISNATSDQIRAHSADLGDLNRPQVTHPLTGRAVDYQTMQDGTVIRTKDNKRYEPPPLAGNVGNFVQAVQACLRAAGVRWCMAEYMSSGFMGNVAELSILAAGSPFVNFIECEQAELGLFYLRWRWIAIRNACRAGLIKADFREVQALVDVHFTPPLVAVANEAEQATTDWGDMDRGVMSIQTRQARRKLDPEQEKRNLAEQPPTRTPGDVTDLDAQGNPVAESLSGPLREQYGLVRELL